ncbi:MAG: preprotein translocase subunit SecG [Planctomycetes bacterium]|nr:preprotein translocase subunit SecG [Planctomycetota bacterium]
MDFLIHDILNPTLWVLFTLGCVVVSGIILLQEGKGGGLGEAFGGAGAQTFGVKAQGIAKVTGYLAGGLVVIAIMIAVIESSSSSVSSAFDSPAAPAGPADGGMSGGAAPGTQPVDGGGQTGGGTDEKDP